MNELFRKLSEENRRLSCTVERELHEKKRLSMENEELHWKIRQSTDAVMSLSTIEGGKEAKAKGNAVAKSYQLSRCRPPSYGVSHRDSQ